MFFLTAYFLKSELTNEKEMINKRIKKMCFKLQNKYLCTRSELDCWLVPTEEHGVRAEYRGQIEDPVLSHGPDAHLRRRQGRDWYQVRSICRCVAEPEFCNPDPGWPKKLHCCPVPLDTLVTNQKMFSNLQFDHMSIDKTQNYMTSWQPILLYVFAEGS